MTQNFLNSTTRSVAWLKDKSDNGQLEIRPPFQRNPVWTEKQKSFLIDSILRGYPIPELYMQEDVDEDGIETYILVDGQQRVTACLEFIEGRFSLNGEDSPEWDSLNFDELTTNEKKKIFSYNFIVRQLPNVSDEEIRIIFSRLNKNVLALNKQELRNATYFGPFIRLAESIADFDYWSGTKIFTANDIRRMLDIEFISELMIGYLHGVQNKKSTLDSWYAAYEENFEREQEVATAFRKSLGELEHLVPAIDKTRWRKKSDFYSLFLALSRYQQQMPFSRDERSSMSNVLIDFARDVDAAITGADIKDPSVRKYVRAVERAASDLANRRAREDVLHGLVSSALEQTAISA